jgi:hypothetical protein
MDYDLEGFRGASAVSCALEGTPVNNLQRSNHGLRLARTCISAMDNASVTASRRDRSVPK